MDLCFTFNFNDSVRFSLIFINKFKNDKLFIDKEKDIYLRFRIGIAEGKLLKKIYKIQNKFLVDYFGLTVNLILDLKV